MERTKITRVSRTTLKPPIQRTKVTQEIKRTKVTRVPSNIILPNFESEQEVKIYTDSSGSYDISPAIAAATLLERREGRRSLSAFVRKVFSTVDPATDYKHNWHVDLICEYLEAATRREIQRLIVNIAPRSLKSNIVSVGWPAWLIGHNPSEQIVGASYSGSLALKHSVDCRTVIQSAWYKNMFPDVELTGDMNTKSEFVTTKRGHRIATSVGGTATGKGGNILLIDDPVNPEEAMSDTARDGANTWYDQTYSTRLNNEDTGVIALVMQRLHTNDLTGHVLDVDDWTHVKIPMKAPCREVIDFGKVKLVREEGDLLHPERVNEKQYQAKCRTLGAYGAAGQLQQDPAPLGGGMVKTKWFGRYRTAPDRLLFTRVVQSWDTAQKENELNDPSVCTTWGEYNNNYYLLDVYSDKLRYPKLKSAAKNLAAKWNPDAILIEDKSSGTSLIQDLRESTSLPILAIEPHGDKVTRMDTCSPTIEAGVVFIPEEAHWLFDFELEVSNFPNVTHDDQVDSLSQFLNWLKKNSMGIRFREL